MNLICEHCQCLFECNSRQLKEKKKYCSTICQSAANSKKTKDQHLKAGRQLRNLITNDCPTCKKPFETKNKSKIFCSMDCYIKSNQFKKQQLKNIELTNEKRIEIAKKNRKGQDFNCLECDKVFYQKRKTETKEAKIFCCLICYRAYMAKRFDRWVANPESMALPQCYDEFLDKEVLPCVVDGCNWHGKHLSLHMNYSHGVMALDFKRATGFNLSTGVVCKSTAKTYSERQLTGIAIDNDIVVRAYTLNKIRKDYGNKITSYRSLESVEHHKKSRALLSGIKGKEKQCLCCDSIFNQNTIFGKALYCSIKCRSKFYHDKKQLQKQSKVSNFTGQTL